MSTDELFLSHDEVLGYIEEFKKDSDYIYGYEKEEFGICPYITFYIYHQEDEVEAIANQVIDLYEEFEARIIDKPFKLRYRKSKSGASTWKNADKWKQTRLEMIEQMHESYKKYFVYFIAATTGDSAVQSARWVFNAQICDNNCGSYTILKLSFGEQWYRNNDSQWYNFVQKCLTTLSPIQAYSGYEIGSAATFNIVSPEFETVERIFSDYFYGLDIDHPNMGRSHHDPDGDTPEYGLGAGLRTPTWCFLLSPYWIEKLGLTEEQIRSKLNDPRIEITKLPDPTNTHKFSLWIRLGDLSLYPVEEGVPDLLVMANELIKPIRCNELKLTTLDAWDDDPNPRFDIESSPQWIARFDEDSTWPEGKRVNLKNNNSNADTKLAIRAGEKCPQSGYWFTVAKENSRQYFEKGNVFPNIKSDWGDVYWQFDGEK